LNHAKNVNVHLQTLVPAAHTNGQRSFLCEREYSRQHIKTSARRCRSLVITVVPERASRLRNNTRKFCVHRHVGE
jgi:hypothetical protein